MINRNISVIEKLESLPSKFYDECQSDNQFGIASFIEARRDFLKKYGGRNELDEYWEYQYSICKESLGCLRPDEHSQTMKFISEADKLYEQSGDSWDQMPTKLNRNMYRELYSNSIVTSLQARLIRLI